MNNISFTAKFSVNNCIKGFDNIKTEQLSKELDKITPKNQKLVLTHRDEFDNLDTFTLRKMDKDGNWNSVASVDVNSISNKALNIERLKNIFSVLKLKAQQDYVESKLVKKLEALRQANSERLQEQMKLINPEV